MNKRRNLCVLALALLLAIASLGGWAASSTADAANIVKGDTKENIRIVQQRLKELGYYTIKVDGI